VDSSISVPLVVQEEIKKLSYEKEFSECMFYDTTKKTMVTLEMVTRDKNNKDTIANFKNVQESFIEKVKEILIKENLQDKYKIEKNRIAIDVQSIKAGKDFGTQKFVNFIKDKNIIPKEFIAFGDGPSDYDMFKELRRERLPSEFIFVGEKELLEGQDAEGIIFSQKLLDEGTLEYLQKESI
jgi:hydroxymethylpyrimidine pyrophosphatase-like HAD family hydrolase